ncbi:hypothetical protein DFH06DRAFT_1185712 [Mycena polygramma]|nr:hypothetical protein DFH06DRAFT_1185712 [Mycena polygramma]
MSLNVQSSLAVSERMRGDALYVHIPSPHVFQDKPHRNPSVRTEPGRPRPLPRPPQPSSFDSPSRRPAPRRRASGGAFVHHAPPAKKSTAFYVCNPSESPISPAQPNPMFAHSPLSPGLINIIPSTPLPPYTPGPRRYSHTFDTKLHPPKLDSPGSELSSLATQSQLPNAKMHRRFGRSVGSIPTSALEELRGLGDQNGHSLPSSPSPDVEVRDDSDGSSDEDIEGDAEPYSWVVEKATRAARPDPRDSLKWADELGGDRWIVDQYSAILRAL